MELLIFLYATFSNYLGLMKMCIFAMNRMWPSFGCLPGMMDSGCPLNEHRAEVTTCLQEEEVSGTQQAI